MSIRTVESDQRSAVSSEETAEERSFAEAPKVRRTFRPLSNFLLVKEMDAKDRTSKSGLIVIPDSATQKLKRGTVVAAGPGYKDVAGNRTPMDVGVGDLVLFSPYTESEISVEDEIYLLMTEREVYGVMETLPEGGN